MKKLRNRAAAAILAAALSVSNVSQVLLAMEVTSPQADTPAESEKLQLSEKTYARYSSVRIAFTPENGHTYKIQKKGDDGSFSDLEGATALNVGGFIDENAGTGKAVTYKIIDTTEANNPKETAEFTSKTTGLKALSEISTLAWVDPKASGTSTVFDGTNVISFDAETTAKVAAMTEGVVIAKAKHTATDINNSEGGAFLGIKSGTDDRFFGYRSSRTKTAVFGYELTNANKCQCLGTNVNNWDMSAGDEGHTVIYRSPANCVTDRLTYIYDGQDGLVGATYPDIFKKADFNDFLTKTTPFDTLSVGGVKDSQGNVTKAWKGEIDYVLITSELLSEAECIAISQANEDLSKPDSTDPNPDTPDPVEVKCSMKAGVFKNTISWNGGGTAVIKRNGSVVAENVTSPYVDRPDTQGDYSYTVTVTTGTDETEFTDTVEMGLEDTAVLYHDFSKDEGPNPTAFDGTRLPYNLLENADDSLKSEVGGIANGAVVIRFKSNTRSDAYNLFFAHKEGVNAQSNWPANNATGAVEGRITNGKRVRFDLTGSAVAELGTVADGRWHTIAFSNVDAEHMNEGEPFSVTLDGSKVFSYAGNSSLANFLTRIGAPVDEFLIGGARLSAGNAASNFAGLFNGEIEYAAVIDEVLSPTELSELTKADMMPLTKDDVYGMTGDKHWVALGGGLASAGNDILGYNESYYKIFHMLVSLDNDSGGSTEAGNQLKRQRYVINRSIPGNTIKDINDHYDSLVDVYGPRAVLLMLDGNEALSDQEIKDNLKAVITKSLDAKRLTLVQIPPVKGEPARDLSALANEVVRDVLANGYTGCENSLVVVDHEALLKEANEDEKCFDEAGNLNARGHLLVAKQIEAVTGKNASGTSNLNTLNKYSVNPLEALKDETPAFTVSDDSVRASIRADGEYTAVLSIDGQTTEKPFTDKSVVFNGLPENTAFTFTIENAQGTAVYKKQAGTTGTAAVSEAEDYASLSSLQQAILNYTTRDEQTTWLFVGDSITHGVYTCGYTGVPDAFERYIHDDLNRPNDTIINGAISNGDFISYNANKYQRYTRWKNEADVVIFMLGTNDSAYSTTDSRYVNYKQNLTEAVKEWKADGKEVILRVPPKIQVSNHANHNNRLIDVRQWIFEVAQEQGCIVADHYNLYETKAYSDANVMTSTGYWFNNSGGKDGIHPVGPGQLAMARQLLEAMGIYESNSRIARQDIIEPVTVTESIKSVNPVWNEQSNTVSYDISALETVMGKTIGQATIEVIKGNTVISRKLVRNENASLGSISANVQDLSGNVEVRVTVRPTDSWANSKYADTVTAKTTINLGGEPVQTFDLTELERQVEAATDLYNGSDTMLPDEWKAYLDSKIDAGNDAIDDPSIFQSQAEVDDSADRLEYIISMTVSASNAYKALAEDADLDLNAYTPSSAADFSKAKTDLSSYMDSTLAGPDGASKLRIDALLEAYATAKANLKQNSTEPDPAVDTTLLRLLINDIDSKGSLDAFSSQNGLKARFETALAEGRTALNSDSQDVIDAATKKLHDLWLDMRYTPDAARLSALQ